METVSMEPLATIRLDTALAGLRRSIRQLAEGIEPAGVISRSTPPHHVVDAATVPQGAKAGLPYDEMPL